MYNKGTLYVGNGTTLDINGNFTIMAGFQNNGTTYISGNVVSNQPSMPAGSGTLVFNGATTQTITGTAAFRSLNVTVNNPGGLQLADRLAIGDGTSGLLTFTNGAIVSGTNTQDVYFYPGSNYTGFTATNQVVGYTTKSGSTDFDFPIGDGTHAADIVLSGLSAAADFQVLYTGVGYGLYTALAPIVSNGVFGQEWWSVTPTAGAASAHISLKWNDSRKSLNHTDPSGLVVAHFTGGVWNSVGGTSTNLAGSSTGMVGPSGVISSFSPFTFGSTATSLPITLGSFTAEDLNCQAYLTWNTTLESNASNFDVQQSTDAVTFVTVANVKAADTAATYHTSVAQQTRQAFYRLKMIDVDGTATYSGIDGLNLACLPQAQRLSVYPNPLVAAVNLTAHLYTPDAKGQAQVQVIDGSGRRVYAMSVTVNSGDNLYSLPTSGLAQGIYNIVVIGDGWRSDVISFSKTSN